MEKGESQQRKETVGTLVFEESDSREEVVLFELRVVDQVRSLVTRI